LYSSASFLCTDIIETSSPFPGERRQVLALKGIHSLDDPPLLPLKCTKVKLYNRHIITTPNKNIFITTR
jgi:hypothetical protein